jgi:hypothetical protein
MSSLYLNPLERSVFMKKINKNDLFIIEGGSDLNLSQFLNVDGINNTVTMISASRAVGNMIAYVNTSAVALSNEYLSAGVLVSVGIAR